jgi:phosphatidylethanolamine/phosphatidyl-N-methylethanolamine N-methyltransferase
MSKSTSSTKAIEKRAADLCAVGHAQFVIGDIEGAAKAFRQAFEALLQLRSPEGTSFNPVEFALERDIWKLFRQLNGDDKVRFSNAWQYPSDSRTLAQAMVSNIDIEAEGPVIELGAGVGKITDELIARGITEERFVLIENRPERASLLQGRYPRALVIEGDAYALTKALRDHNVGPASAMVSMLPLHGVSSARRKDLLRAAVNNLQPGKPFILASFKGPPIMGLDVGVQGSEPIWVAIPPARIWVYRRGGGLSFPVNESKNRIAGSSQAALDLVEAILAGRDISSELRKTLPETKKKAPVIDRLPEAPPRLWPRTTRGPSKKGPLEQRLLAFLREVYAPYIEAGFRNELRAYISAHDHRLYQTIVNFERRGGELPADLAMPARPELVQQRLKKAVEEGLDSLTRPERQSVTNKLLRHAKLTPDR